MQLLNSGSYATNVALAVPRLTVAVLIFTFISPATNNPQLMELRGPSAVIPAPFFGLHIHQAGSATPWPSFPVSAWRLWDANVSWNFLQPEPNEWNFTLLDQYLELAQRHHTEILLTLGYTPQWAASRPDEVSASGLPGVASNPRELSAWREYVRKVATRYKGRIHLYEVWNEANLRGYYSGTVGQMVTLAREAYTVLKEVDSANLVLSPSGMGRGSNIQWLDDFFSQGGGKYCDIVAYHFYVTPAPPEEMLNVIADVKQLLKLRGINKPVWNTETGWDMEKKFVDDEEKMAYLARAYILAWVEGVDRVYWYAYDNYTWASLALTFPDHRTLNSAGRAYTVLQSWLIGRRLNSCATDSNGFWTCRLTDSNGSAAWIMWASARPGMKALPSPCCKNMKIQYLDGRWESRDQAKPLGLGGSPVLIEDKTSG